MGLLSTSIPTTALSLLLLLLLLFARASEAQNCYYPNGALSTSDAACSSDGDSACCPLNWDCLSNGLCYNPSQDFYGRYTCTDQTWQSSACPQFCAYAGAGDDSPAAGDQALLQDDDGDWCCTKASPSTRRAPRLADAAAPRPCTNQTDAVFFSLPAGTTVASISTLVPTTSAPSVSNAPLSTTQGTPVSTAGDSPTTTTTSDSRPPSSTSPAASSRTTTSAQTSTIASSIVTTGRNGATTTIVTTSTAAPPLPTAPSTPSPPLPPPKSSIHLSSALPITLTGCAELN
ncbi:btb poz domain protein, partial [Teratosphaeria destructans]